MDRIDYTTLAAQKRLVLEEAVRRQRLEQARVYAAYAQLAEHPSFEIVLCSLIQRVMLAPITTDRDMGRHDLLLSILTDVRFAVEGSRGTGVGSL